MSNAPGYALMTVALDEATLEAAAQALDVSPDAIDAAYGLVAIDPARQLYALRVRAAAIAPEFAASDKARGPYADVKVAPFGAVKRHRSSTAE